MEKVRQQRRNEVYRNRKVRATEDQRETRSAKEAAEEYSAEARIGTGRKENMWHMEEEVCQAGWGI